MRMARIGVMTPMRIALTEDFLSVFGLASTVLLGRLVGMDSVNVKVRVGIIGRVFEGEILGVGAVTIGGLLVSTSKVPVGAGPEFVSLIVVPP